MADRRQLFHDGGWRWFIGAQDHDRIGARSLATYMHKADIDVRLAQECADTANNPWAIPVRGEEQVALGWEIDPQIIDTYDIRLTL